MCIGGRERRDEFNGIWHIKSTGGRKIAVCGVNSLMHLHSAISLRQLS